MAISGQHDQQQTAPDSPAAVLADLRVQRETARAAEVATMVDAVAWAAMHSVDSLTEAATLPGTEGAVAIAGQGAPVVAEFAVTELATVLGRSTDSGRVWLGQVLECRYRLHGIWAALTAGRVEPWQARRIADRTIALNPEAAAWVDRQLAPVAHRTGPAQLDRIIEEAIARFDPDTAKAQAERRAESRYFAIDTHQVTTDGCVDVHGVLDLADALDLDDAVNATATLMLRLGSTESLDVRRAKAVGEIARNDLTLTLPADAEAPAGQARRDDGAADPAGADSAPGERVPVPRRQVVLYTHLSVEPSGDVDPFVRVENTRSLITLDQLRTWLAVDHTVITVRPVIDLEQHLEVPGYEPSDRLRELVHLTNPRCAFPYCTRPSRRCDCDHVTAHADGGPTCSCNLAPLCRRHHRAKTHTAWTYDTLDFGKYLWRSPHGLMFRVDPDGTTPIEPAARQRHPSRP